MLVEQVLEDIVTGQESAALAKVESWWSNLLPEIEAEMKILASAEGQILQGLLPVAAQDVINGGLTTASFVAAGKDVISKLVAQNVNLGTQTVFSALNAVVSSKVVSAAPATASVTPAAS